MSALHVRAAGGRCMSALRVSAACRRCMSALQVGAAGGRDPGPVTPHTHTRHARREERKKEKISFYRDDVCVFFVNQFVLTKTPPLL
jgi:hypothetical protein